ncbi:MAG: HAMP domain-containing sensor histidine kinase [Anaerolineales bacterium]
MTAPAALRQFPFFAAFPDEQLGRLAARLPRVRLPAGSVVFSLGEASATMSLILAGRVAIHRLDEAGAVVELGTLEAHQTFGELALLSREPRMATVTTLTECDFLTLDRPLLLELIAGATPEAILSLFAMLSQQIRAANEGDFRKLLASRTLESQMEAARQRSLTQMVAGVAHEINTPLGVAATAASIVARELDRLEPLAADRQSKSAVADMREALGLMDGNLQRAHKLVQDFKKVSVSQLSDVKEALDLPEAIEDTLRLAQLTLKQRQIAVSFVNGLPAGADTWVGYRGYLAQILLNLLTNVERYAYPAGQGGPAEVGLALEGERDYRLTVRDFGRGIPPADLERVFEPFFTTGRSSGGTGLGMTIVYNLATAALKGRIDIQSALRQGTEVRLIFPRVVPD